MGDVQVYVYFSNTFHSQQSSVSRVETANITLVFSLSLGPHIFNYALDSPEMRMRK